MTGPCLKLYVTVTGVKKRARKTRRELLDLGHVPLDTAAGAAMLLAQGKLAQEMREWESATLHLDYVEITEGHGYRQETWQPFDARHKKIGITRT